MGLEASTWKTNRSTWAPVCATVLCSELGAINNSAFVKASHRNNIKSLVSLAANDFPLWRTANQSHIEFLTTEAEEKSQWNSVIKSVQWQRPHEEALNRHLFRVQFKLSDLFPVTETRPHHIITGDWHLLTNPYSIQPPKAVTAEWTHLTASKHAARISNPMRRYSVLFISLNAVLSAPKVIYLINRFTAPVKGNVKLDRLVGTCSFISQLSGTKCQYQLFISSGCCSDVLLWVTPDTIGHGHNLWGLNRESFDPVISILGGLPHIQSV